MSNKSICREGVRNWFSGSEKHHQGPDLKKKTRRVSRGGKNKILKCREQYIKVWGETFSCEQQLHQCSEHTRNPPSQQLQQKDQRILDETSDYSFHHIVPSQPTRVKKKKGTLLSAMTKHIYAANLIRKCSSL